MKRNGKIELLRIIFCFCVVLTHSKVFMDHKMFIKGALAVDFFFFVSGYLMANSAFKKRTLSLDHLGAETCTFISRKIRALMPNFMIAYGVAAIVMFSGQWQMESKKAVIKRLLETVWEPLQLTMAGFGTQRVNGVDWYISAMLLAMFILYPIIRKHFEMFIHVIGPAIAIFLYGYMYAKSGSPMGVFDEMLFATKGLFRAFAGISLGAGLYPVVKYLAAQRLSSFSRCLVTLTETFCYGIFIYYCLTARNGRFDFQMILLVAVGVVCSFSHQGVFAALFDNPVSYFLGAFSLDVYLSHLYWGRWIDIKLANMGDKEQFLCYISLCLATAFVIHVISRLIRLLMSKVDLKSIFIA
ncbi:MAG: acyltransferase family protein [Dorea sp.]|nr:acyltransferase family protein [Dorea sp.]